MKTFEPIMGAFLSIPAPIVGTFLEISPSLMVQNGQFPSKSPNFWLLWVGFILTTELSQTEEIAVEKFRT